MIEDFIEETEEIWPDSRIQLETSCHEPMVVITWIRNEYEDKLEALRREVKDLYENYMYTSGKWSG